MISIVDDDQSVREATGSLVRSFGYDARTFSSAEEFLDSALAGTSDCVITDVEMPGLSGVELQDRLKSLGHSTPVIFVTAFANEKVRKQAIKAGAIGVLSKPFDCAALIACIETALKARSDRTSGDRR